MRSRIAEPYDRNPGRLRSKLKAKRSFAGAGIALCAALVCIGAVLVISTAMASTPPDSTQASSSAQEALESQSLAGEDSAAADADETTSPASDQASSQVGSPIPAEDGNSSSSDAQSTSSSIAPASTSDNSNSPGQADQKEPSAPAASQCTISIDCSAALANRDKLSAGIIQNLPASGLILSPSAIELAEGDTAFSVLQKACSTAGISLDYTGGLFGSSAYVRSIGPIGEFDCGSQSGWTYMVNGQMVFAGASDYVLQPGDTLTWSYTCSL